MGIRLDYALVSPIKNRERGHVQEQIAVDVLEWRKARKTPADKRYEFPSVGVLVLRCHPVLPQSRMPSSPSRRSRPQALPDHQDPWPLHHEPQVHSYWDYLWQQG